MFLSTLLEKECHTYRIQTGIAYKRELILKVWLTQVTGAWKETEWLCTPFLNYWIIQYVLVLIQYIIRFPWQWIFFLIVVFMWLILNGLVFSECMPMAGNTRIACHKCQEQRSLRWVNSLMLWQMYRAENWEQWPCDKLLNLQVVKGHWCLGFCTKGHYHN